MMEKMVPMAMPVAMQQMQVTVPPGVGPGMPFLITTQDGQQMQITHPRRRALAALLGAGASRAPRHRALSGRQGRVGRCRCRW